MLFLLKLRGINKLSMRNEIVIKIRFYFQKILVRMCVYVRNVLQSKSLDGFELNLV